MTAPTFDDGFRDQLALLMAWRRDVRHFRPDPLDEDLISDLLRTATRAPSVGNSQPWRFVRVDAPQRRRAIIDHVEAQRHAAGTIYDDARRQQYDTLKLHGLIECPLVLGVFCVADPREGHGLGRATMPEALVHSTVCAIHSLWLAARAQGVGMGWVSIVRPDAMAGLLDVPAAWQFVALLCLGYPAFDDDTPLLQRSSWQDRLPLDAMVVQR